jgi:hypothetical protein
MFIYMNIKNPMENPNHWRQRADQTRAKADQIWRDTRFKRHLLRVAEEYDRLAQRAEQWRSSDQQA